LEEVETQKIKMNKNFLIIGSSGLVGSTFLKNIFNKHKIFVTYNNNPPSGNYPSKKINLLENLSDLKTIIDDFKPDVIVDTAAYPSVDYCESNPQLASSLHVDSTKQILEYCSKYNSKFCYISTDAVFDGKLNRKYTETDIPNPLSHYGKTKLEAEKVVLKNHNNVVLRTTVIYGKHDRSRFTNWVLENLQNKQIVPAFTDQNNTPTLVNDFSIALLRIIESDLSGLFHATGGTCLNRYEFATKLAIAFGLDKNLIKPVTANEQKQGAPRPVNGCLDNQKLEKEIGFKFKDIDEGIEYLK
jgi:dTDP-4-dehydrorhamnose reductase